MDLNLVESKVMLVDLKRLLSKGEIENAEGRLAHRLCSIRKVVELLDQTPPRIMVETGCQSSALLFAHGMSTCIFGALAQKYGAILHTIDRSKGNIEKCRMFSREYAEYIRYNNGNSVNILKKLDDQIDFLYLDSLDFSPGNEEKSRSHQLKEIKTAYPKLSDHCVVLLDDANVQMWFGYKLNSTDIQGKTYYAHKFLMDRGAECIIDTPNYQRLYVLRKT